MKQLKNVIYFIFALTVILSCEKEMVTVLPENAEVNNEQEPTSVLEIVEMGIDVESYFQSLPEQDNYSKTQTISHKVEDSNLQFFLSPDEFGCIDLPMEDFEEGRGNSIGFPSPLNEDTNNVVFEPGEIVEGISFRTNSEYSSGALAFFDAFGAGSNTSKIIVANYFADYFVIEFTTDDVFSVSLSVIAWQDRYPATTIDVYGSSGLLGQTVVNASSSGVYLAINSNEPIIRITLNSYGGAEGVANISFGDCDDDDDGVLNGEDPYPHSNLSEEVSIDGCNPNVENVFVVPGATMMDYIDEIINEVNAQYDGSNWEELHREFSNQLASLTADWKADRLISRRQRSAIFRCVGDADIPYFIID